MDRDVFMFRLAGLDPGQLRACTFSRWSPVIGDPGFAGWLTVAVYAICAVLAFLVLRRGIDRHADGGRVTVRVFWLFVCFGMAFLSVNKQLDLQSLLTAVGRCIAQAQGWYGERRMVQRQFVEGFLVAAVLLLLFGLFLLRRDLARHGLALLGLVVAAGFVAVRAVSFHHFDAILHMRVQSVRYNVILELTGPTLIALNAIWLLRRRRAPR